ncbi:retrotransposon protein, putative, ty1-copia subclass [Tanacetum coccineum]
MRYVTNAVVGSLEKKLLIYLSVLVMKKKEESFLKELALQCVACMSGKMARKPYSHQVERAKVLLGLIHTDVCGPLKIRQGNDGLFFLLPTQEQSPCCLECLEFFENEVIDHEASGSLEDLEIIQEEDTHPSLDTSLNHEEDDQEVDEPKSDINPIRRSTRTRRSRQLVDLLPNGKTVGHKWLLKKKTDMNRAIHTYKARLVAKGFTQTLGIDYEETFSLVADIRAIRILIAIVAFYDYEIWQIE